MTPTPETLVEVGAEPFGWRRTLYGPQAWQCPYDDALRNEAVEGSTYALHRLADQLPCVRVVITEIVERSVDTGPEDVKFAAAHALWQAVGLHSPVGPHIDQDGTLA
ncbi:hypothetical protein ACWEWI_37905 [Streptomyces sp. NPDC003753]